MQYASINRISVYHLHLGEANSLLEAGRRGDSGHHHEFHEFLTLPRQLATLSLLEAILGRRDILACERLEKHLQLVLPKLLLPRLVEEREFAHMVYKDESEDREFGIVGGDLTQVGLEGGSEATEGGGRVQLADFPSYLLRDELSLEVCATTVLLATRRAHTNTSC